MRCIDSPLLEDLLLGRARTKRWLSTLVASEGEVAAAEVSFAELGLSALGHGPGGPRRIAALEDLRRELTVLPFDAEATHATLRLTSAGSHRGLELLPLMVAGTSVAKGATHLLTDDRRKFPRQVAPLKIVRY